MIDSSLLLDQTDMVVAALARKGVSPENTRAARDALVERRNILTEVEGLRAEMNRRSKQIGRLISSGDPSADPHRTAWTNPRT